MTLYVYLADVPPPSMTEHLVVLGLPLFVLVLLLIWLVRRKKKGGAQAPPPERHTLPHGREIFHYNKGETDIIYKELWGNDAYLPPELPLSVTPGATVIDAGANIGMFSIYIWDRLDGDVQLYAFEPVPAIYDVLSANAAMLNEAGPGRVQTFPVGLSANEETVRFLHHPKMSIWSTGHSDFDQKRAEQLDKDIPDIVDFVVEHEAPRWVRKLPRGLVEWGARVIAKAANETKEIECQLRPLSAIIDEQGIETIDLLKIDVEGNELPLLQGLRDEHWPRIAQITMEVEDLETLEQIKALLEGRGFSHASALAADIHATGVESELSYLRAWRES